MIFLQYVSLLFASQSQAHFRRFQMISRNMVIRSLIPRWLGAFWIYFYGFQDLH